MAQELTAWSEKMRARWEPLRDQVAFAAARGDDAVGYHEDVVFEIGSAFKAFVAAAYAQQVAKGELDPAMQLTVQPVDRVDSSLVLDGIPDGGSIPLRDAAEAMIGASDNTATDLLLRAVVTDRVRDLLESLGVTATFPDATRQLYERWAANPKEPVNGAMATMADLVRFYQRTVGDGALGESATAVFLPLMREEDIVQGAQWPDGVTAYRKSGMVEPPPMLAMSLAGAFAPQSGAVTAFAFALNIPFAEDAAYEDSPLDPLVHIFSDGLRRGLQELAVQES